MSVAHGPKTPNTVPLPPHPGPVPQPIPINSHAQRHFAKRPATTTGKRTKYGKASFTTSKLAAPDEHGAIYTLASQFQQYLHMPDPAALYALMGAVAGNMLHGGDPLWLMIVGPSGSGKTTLLKSLRRIGGVHLMGDVDTKAAFLSGVKKKEQAAGSKGGLLNEIGKQGAFVWYEFTAVLQLPRDALKSILTALRQIYDGYYSRDVGTEGHRKLEWTGRLAAFAGVTNAIDQAHEFGSQMGERFILYRLPMTDGWGESYKSLERKTHETREGTAEDLALLVEAFFHSLDMGWEGQPVRELDTGEKNRLIAAGQFAAKSRSGVLRDFHNREIVDVPTSEAPMRFIQQFERLYLGMEAIGVDEEDRWRVVGKVTMDSMPQVRRVAMEAIMARGSVAGGGKAAGLGEVGDAMRVSAATVKRVVEDLEVHGLVVHAEEGKGWVLTKWAEERLKAAGVMGVVA